MKKILTILGFMLLLWSISFAQENRLDDKTELIKYKFGQIPLIYQDVEALKQANQNDITLTEFENALSRVALLEAENALLKLRIDTLFSRIGSVIISPAQAHTNLRGVGGIFKNTIYWHPSVTAGIDSSKIIL